MSKWIAEFELEDGDTMPEHMDLEYKGIKIDFHCRPLSSSEIPNKSEISTSSDCVDRHAVDMLAYRYLKEPTDNHVAFYEDFLDLPSVVPIRPKGRWIEVELPARDAHECSKCGGLALLDENGNEQLTYFCPNCGVKMEEVKE